MVLDLIQPGLDAIAIGHGGFWADRKDGIPRLELLDEREQMLAVSRVLGAQSYLAALARDKAINETEAPTSASGASFSGFG